MRAGDAKSQAPAADCDVRKVDWKNFAYDKGTVLVEGQQSSRSKDPNSYEGVTIQLDDVQYRDLDADKKLEAHVRLRTVITSDAPDSPRGMSIENLLKMWVFALDPKCMPRLLGVSNDYSDEERVVGNAYAIDGQAWGLVANKFRPLPKTDPLATELRVAALYDVGKNHGTIADAYLKQAQPAHQALDRATACLERAVPKLAKRLKLAQISDAAWRKAQTAAQSALALATRKPNDRSAWLRASETDANAIAAAWPAIEDTDVGYDLRTVAECQNGLADQLKDLQVQLTGADQAVKALGKTVAQLKAEKIRADHQAQWAQTFETRRTSLASWQKSAAALRARLAKAQKLIPKGAPLDKAPPQGESSPRSKEVRAALDALGQQRAVIQAGLEQAPGYAVHKIGDEVPGCEIRNVDFSNLRYVIDGLEHELHAGAAHLEQLMDPETGKPVPSDAKPAKKAKKKKLSEDEELERRSNTTSHNVDLWHVEYANLDPQLGQEAYVSLHHLVVEGGAAEGVTAEHVLVFDKDAACHLRLRGIASHGVTMGGGSSLAGKRVVLVDDRAERREWGFDKGEFVQLAGAAQGASSE